MLIFHHAAQQVDFAFLQTNLVLDLALPDDGLGDSADVGGAVNLGNFHGDLQSDIAVGMHAGSDVDVHAHIEILKLGIDQGVDADAADAGLK